MRASYPSNGFSAARRTLFLGLALVGLCLLGIGPGQADETQGAAEEAPLSLVMIEEHGCPWCRRWDEEIGTIYPKTAEGKRAPLRRVDIHAPRPNFLQDIQPTRFTPTFILLAGGQEVGRITGYPGQDFFWGMLQSLFDKHDAAMRGEG